MLRRAIAAVAGALLLLVVFGGIAERPRARPATDGGTPICRSVAPGIEGAQESSSSEVEAVAMHDVVTRAVDGVVAAIVPVEDLVDPPKAACPEGMVHVSGDYCTEVRHQCKEWLDDPRLPYARCAEYALGARCVGQRISLNFCIDRYEYTAPGEDLPANFQSFVTGSKICRQQGKRLCTEREWNFACEGEEMRPYPYGWKREPKCNQDRDDLYEIKRTKRGRKQVLRDHRAPASSYPDCVSPFGVQNMVGNLDEPVLREVAKHNPPFRNGLKGGWWMAGRNRCRPATTAHDDYYRDIQVGVRCCADLPRLPGASG